MTRRLQQITLVAWTCLAAVSCEDPLPSDAMQRTMFDHAIAQALMQTTIVLYDNHVAGKLSGAVDVNVSCPDGGTARIAGTVTPSPNGGLTNIDLTFDMSACHAVLPRASSGHSALRTTGVIRKTASFSATTATATYQSSGQLAVSGTLKLVINSRTRLEPAIDESCVFTATATRTQASGTYCGRPFSY